MTQPTTGAAEVEAVVAEVFGIYERRGTDDYIGEPVSQIEHMSQCAELAEEAGHDREVILAAFFHDIGHICEAYDEGQDMDGYGHISHEKVGADFLRVRGFSEKVAALVEGHVQAKRFLCARNPDYFAKLSPASVKTLEFQGGPMTEAEAVRFEASPWYRLSIQMRAWDELGKEENRPLPPLERYREMARQHLLEQKSLHS
jgi:phosphonate degradation associated HDIG domain protein